MFKPNRIVLLMKQNIIVRLLCYHHNIYDDTCRSSNERILKVQHGPKYGENRMEMYRLNSRGLGIVIIYTCASCTTSNASPPVTEGDTFHFIVHLRLISSNSIDHGMSVYYDCRHLRATIHVICCVNTYLCSVWLAPEVRPLMNIVQLYTCWTGTP